MTMYQPIHIPYPDRVHVGTKLTGWQDPTAIMDKLVRCNAIEVVEPCGHGNYAGHIIGGIGLLNDDSRPWIMTTAENEPCWCDGNPEEKR